MNPIESKRIEKLAVAYSTCPNDTFIFHALAHGLIECEGIAFDTVLKDVEALNQDARLGRYEISKLSFAAIGNLAESYGLLRSGAALGRGCGPLIVARPGFDPSRLKSVAIAAPGLWTTACMLLGLYLGEKPNAVPMRFDKIMPAVQRGEFEAGVIIHEGRFTYGEYGLISLMDLGQWWEEETGLPIPLGGICAARSLGEETVAKAETAIRQSVVYAREHPGAADAYIRRHAAEMSESVVASHIELYVNDFSIDLGEEGEKAVEKLFALAGKAGMIPAGRAPLFACGT